MSADPTGDLVRAAVRAAGSREAFWVSAINATGVQTAAELGVFRGSFAARLLGACPSIRRYYLVDPWRHLANWNKPANRSDAEFEAIFREAMDSTAFAQDRRVVLRGTTQEVIERIPDGSLDYCYVDGDHTLRGITVDLFHAYRKVRPGGVIGGDDLCASIWQHGPGFEPTLVFPYVIHFAEAVGARVFALPHDQFLLHKDATRGFAFDDLAGKYGDLRMARLLKQRDSFRHSMRRVLHGIARRFGNG